MSESCNHDCGSCQASCGSRQETNSLLEPLHPLSRVKKVIGIVSGKGGVGKSLVTSMLAVKMRHEGFEVGILDGDITGPSIPRSFGIDEKIGVNEEGLMIPARSTTGIQVMSANLILVNETDPVIWRGPVVAGVLKQFWQEVLWENVDYMFVDMPPGTGDVPLTVFQSIPLDGIIIVTSPQDLVTMIVAKAVNMAKKMDVPILGMVENMSYLECPDCKKRISIFGESHGEETAASYGIPLLAQIPIRPSVAEAVDQGTVEYLNLEYLDEAAQKLKTLF